ncbi:MAG: hypothetical protein N3B13_04180 [Deltaproteobacteria bacterium]|nr:hypothetical protein [Deltaproteobacteria bacterium]
MSHHIFKKIILLGRPAAGKSEVIDFIKRTNPEERRSKLHIGDIVEFDDFLYVWQTFEDDDIWDKKLHKPRKNTSSDYYFYDHDIWNFFIHKINLAYAKEIARNKNLHDTHTALIEFSRGGENGFGEAFSHLSDEILKDAGIVYISVSYEESVRKNRRRFRPELADSILYHSLPDDKMEFYYRVNDWEKLTGNKPSGYIRVRNFDVPFSVLYNEPEVTDSDSKLGPALINVFDTLIKLMK